MPPEDFANALVRGVGEVEIASGAYSDTLRGCPVSSACLFAFWQTADS
jgi:hypothetical protein